MKNVYDAHKGIVLGHHISFSEIKVNPTKIQVIVNLMPPKTQKEVRIFLEYESYYKRFIENFSKIALPLFKLLAKYIEFQWTTNCQNAFEKLKDNFSIAPILKDQIGHFNSTYLLMLQI